MHELKQPKRICFISSRSGFIDQRLVLWMDWSNGRLVEELQKRYLDNFSIAIFVDNKKEPKYDTPVSANRIYRLPFPFSYKGGVINTFKINAVLKQIEKENDALIVQLPIIGFISLLSIRKPAVFHVCANVLTASINPVKYRGVHALVARLTAYTIHTIHRIVFSQKRNRLIVNGVELGNVYKDFNPTIATSSSLLSTDILPRSLVKSQIGLALQLIFIGRPSLEKGFDILIQALSKASFDFKLTIVGFNSAEFKKMLPSVFQDTRGIHDKLEFLGYIGWGEELKSIIRRQDALVVPSRSEGTPRIILECMSQGVPAIASNTGGIPGIVEDGQNGFLFTPGDPEDLLLKIYTLYRYPEIKEKLILSGLRKASQNTIDNFASHFFSTIEVLTNE